MQVMRSRPILISIDSAVHRLCARIDHQHAHCKRKRELHGMLDWQVLGGVDGGVH